MKPLVTTLEPTVVSLDVVQVDGKLLAEMTDGSVLEFSLYRTQDERELRSAYGWRYLTRAQLVEKVARINADHMAACNHAMHLDKVRRLGQDYRSRGYY